MFTEPYNAIAVVVAYGTLPVIIAWCAIGIHRSNARHLFAKPCGAVVGAIGVPVAVTILNAINISKYPGTDFVFGVVFVIWFAAIGGLIGAAVDRLRFGRSDASQTKTP